MTNPPVIDTPENWDAAGPAYSERIGPVMMEAYAAEFTERLGADANMEALEVAAGAGALTATLARRVKTLHATDFSPKMIEIPRERMTALGITNVKCDVMDGQALEFKDDSFDCAACCFGLMLFPDRARGFSELSRVLRPRLINPEFRERPYSEFPGPAFPADCKNWKNPRNVPGSVQ